MGTEPIPNSPTRRAKPNLLTSVHLSDTNESSTLNFDRSPSPILPPVEKEHATSLLNLEVKVLFQPLGAENVWVEQGDGLVEFCNFTIRVVRQNSPQLDVSESTRTIGKPANESQPVSAPHKEAAKVEKDGEKGHLGEEEMDADTTHGEVSTLSNASVETNATAEVTTSTATSLSPSSSLGEGLTEEEAVEEFSASATKVTHAGVSLSDDRIVMEDTITDDTPFVGENCCIVWNSLDKRLSLCLMYVSEEGYLASWGALVALQQKPHAMLRFDLLDRCAAPSKTHKMKDGEAQAVNEDVAEKDTEWNMETERPPPLPYSYFIHNEYDPPLGFVEQHALASSIIENRHALNPALYKDPQTVRTLLSISTPDLLLHLVTDEVYPLLAASLGETLPVPTWRVPQGLTKLPVPDGLCTLITKELRLHHLIVELLPGGAAPEPLSRLVGCLRQRLQNEILCTLLENDEMLVQAKEALLTSVPVALSSSIRPSRGLLLLERSASGFSSASEERPESAQSSAAELSLRAEQQVLAHLRFFRNLINLTVTTFRREAVIPVIVNVLRTGMLETLSLVAERYGMPPGCTAIFTPHHTSTNVTEEERGRLKCWTSGSTVNGAQNALSNYSPAVEQELVALLDATLVRLNERQAIEVMAEHIYTPILDDPSRYHGLLTFVVHQLIVGRGAVTGKRFTRDVSNLSTPNLSFHILGLRDDGISAVDRIPPENDVVEKRNRFQKLFIQRYLVQGTRGVVLPVPSAPSTSSIGMTLSTSKNPPASQVAVGSSLSSNALPPGISPALIQVLEFAITSASVDNRELLLKAIFQSKSRVLQYMDKCFELASQHSKLIPVDVLCGNVRLLRTVLVNITSFNPVISRRMESNALFAVELPFGSFSHGCATSVPKTMVRNICRNLTVGRDIFGSLFKVYNAIGGTHKCSTFHSAVCSLLDFIEKSSSQQQFDFEYNNIRDIRDFIYLKHREKMPSLFVSRFNEAILSDLQTRLGHSEGGYSPNMSCSVFSCGSSSAGELSRGKLRFVDELEAGEAGASAFPHAKSLEDSSPPTSSSSSPSSALSSAMSVSFPRKLRAMVEQLSPSPVALPLAALHGVSPSPLPTIAPSRAAFPSTPSDPAKPSGKGDSDHSPVHVSPSPPTTQGETTLTDEMFGGLESPRRGSEEKKKDTHSLSENEVTEVMNRVGCSEVSDPNAGTLAPLPSVFSPILTGLTVKPITPLTGKTNGGRAHNLRIEENEQPKQRRPNGESAPLPRIRRRS